MKRVNYRGIMVSPEWSIMKSADSGIDLHIKDGGIIVRSREIFIYMKLS